MRSAAKYVTKDKQKLKNLSDILYYIIEKGETTRREIQRETGFSWGTVSEGVSKLIADGYLKEENKSDGKVGRSSSFIKPSGENIVSIGVDVNLTALSAVVLGFDLETKWQKTAPFCAQNQSEVLKWIEDAISEAILSCPKGTKILSIGIAMQGKVDSISGISYRFPSIKDWKEVNIKEIIEEKFNTSVSVEHDPKCLIFAKTFKQKISDALLLRIDRGIGLAVIGEGKILNDFGKMEIGHTIAVSNGEECSCGKKGCLEAYSSIRGLERRAKKSFEEFDESDCDKVFGDACLYLSRAIYNLCMLFSPQKVILTGKLIRDDRFFKKLEAEVQKIEIENVEIERDFDISAAYGAAVLSIKDVIKKNEI